MNALLRIEALHFVLPHQSKNEHGLRRTSDNEIFSGIGQISIRLYKIATKNVSLRKFFTRLST